MLMLFFLMDMVLWLDPAMLEAAVSGMQINRGERAQRNTF